MIAYMTLDSLTQRCTHSSTITYDIYKDIQHFKEALDLQHQFLSYNTNNINANTLSLEVYLCHVSQVSSLSILCVLIKVGCH